MTCHYPVLGSACFSVWSCRLENLLQPEIRSTTHIWVVTRHQFESLRSFLRRHFAKIPLVALRNGRLFSYAREELETIIIQNRDQPLAENVLPRLSNQFSLHSIMN